MSQKNIQKSSVFGKINFFLLSVLVFVLVASSSYALNKRSQLIKLNNQIVERTNLFDSFKSGVLSSQTQLSPIPILKEGSTFPDLSANSVVIIDIESGITLYEKNSVEQVYPASTTKIVTALVALNEYSPDDVLLVSAGSLVDGQKMGLVEGEEITVENLLQGLLIHSANDAAYTLAENFPLGYENFIEMMNLKATSIGLVDTNFTNPAGYDQPGHVSSARDMARAAAYAMKNDKFAEIVGTKSKEVTSVDGLVTHKLENTNELLGEVDGVIGTKTGWTENAHENLITYARRDGHTIVIALLGSQDRFSETKKLIEWVYQNYVWEEVFYP